MNTAPGPGDININPLPENTQALRRYAQQYDYDEIGNILKVIHQATGGNCLPVRNKVKAGTRHYHYNFSQNNYLLSTSPDNNPPTTDQYTYDAHGSMLSMPHLTSMDWDFADRLQVADLGSGGMAYYVYDAGGERIRKVIERNRGVKEERFYLGGWEVYRKSQGGTLELERETLHMMDDERRIVLVDSLTVDNASVLTSPTQLIRYQFDNHLNSAGLELDETAAVISYEEYYPFGTTSYRSGRSNAEVALKRYRYVGKERDDETGLYYYGARYYASWLAQFVSVDPLKDDYPQLSPFNYADNNPISDLDIDTMQNTRTPKRNRLPKHARGSFNADSRIYTVAGGGEEEGFDTLFSIAERFGVSVEYLKGVNDLIEDDIYAGQELYIPTQGVDFEEIFIGADSLQTVKVIGDRINQDIKEVFGRISNDRVNNFVFQDTSGIKATRLTTAGRKLLQTAVNAAGITPIGGLVAAGVQVFAGTADENTVLGAGTATTELVSGTLEGTDLLTKLFKGISSFADKGLITLNQAAIVASPATEEELLTELLFLELKTNPNRFGRFVLGREFEQFLFNEELSKKGVEAIIDILNTSLANLRSEINENKIDITTDEGFKRAKQAIIKKNQIN